MTYKWAVYNKNGGLIKRTLTKGRAQQAAQKYAGSYVKETYSSESSETPRDYYGNGGK